MPSHKLREPLRGVRRLVLPLPFQGLDRVNAFLLVGGEKDALVDCGIFFPSEENDHGWDDLTAALEAAGSAPERIGTLVVTHTHIDHYGMAARLVETAGCDLWMHRLASEDLQMYREPEKVALPLREMFVEHGVSQEDLEGMLSFEDWSPFVSGVIDPSVPLDGGEVLEVGDRRWEVVHTPGHARSHICLWDSGDRVLISGDHLLPTITPHIDFRRGEDEDPLGDFLDSLARIERLDPRLVLPGHGRPFEDGADRARVIARHHDRRLGSILQVIRNEAHTASEITDEIFSGTLLHFERRLALGEALAHLVYLRRNGDIERIRRDDGTYVYRKVGRRSAGSA